MSKPTKFTTDAVRLSVDMEYPRKVTVLDLSSGMPLFDLHQDGPINIAEIVKYDVEIKMDSPFYKINGTNPHAS